MDIEQTIQEALGDLDWWSKSSSRGEIKLLPELLNEAEMPESTITGTYKNGDGILVATNKRAIFVDKGIKALRVEEFLYERITSIEYTTAMLFGGVIINTAGDTAKIGRVPNAIVRPLDERLRLITSNQVA